MVVKGQDGERRPILCLSEAKVQVSSSSTRPRAMCVRCAEEAYDRLFGDGVAMRMLPHVLEELLNH